jgi:uncharacterized membrane protein YgcG
VDSDVPHNQAGASDTEPGAKVLPFRGEWFGSADELVPFGPRARDERAAADARERAAVEAAGSERVNGQEPAAAETAKPSAQPHVAADDFWAGLADAGDLVQFPAAPGAAAAAVGPGGSLAHRRRPVWLGVAVAVLGFVVIGLRLSNGAESGALQPGAALAQTAQTALSITKVPVYATGVDQQQMREVPLKVRSSGVAPRSRPHVSHRETKRASQRVLVSQSRPSSVHSQPAVYSPPSVPRTPSVPASGSGPTTSSSGSRGGGGGGGGSGSGGGNSHGGGSHRAGPSGRGAAFGPGKMGG